MSKIILIKYYNFTFIVIFQRLHLNIYINEGQVDMENLQNEVSINENKINQLCQMCILTPTGPEV
jgi:energy-converting hydrogenase Eha subunit H